MNLREYAASLTTAQRLEWAGQCGIKDGYLSQLTGGHSKPHPLLLRKLCEASGWACHPAEIMPEVFDGIPAKKGCIK